MESTLALLVPIIVPLGAFVMIYFLAKQSNETKRKMIENGMNPNDDRNKRTPTPGALKFGGLLVGAGLGLFLASLITNAFTIADQDAIYFGLIALLGGLGLILAHNYARKQFFEDKDRM